MWNQDNNDNNYHDGNHPESLGGGYAYYSESTGSNDNWDSSGIERPREQKRSGLHQAIDRYNLNDSNSVHSGHNGLDNGLDIFSNPTLHHVTSSDVRDLAGSYNSHSSAQFGQPESFYQDHPSYGNTAGNDDYGFRSNSVASNSSASRYVYERLSHDQSPSMETLSLQAAARIQSFDNGHNGVSGIGASLGNLQSSGGEVRHSGASSIQSCRHARRLYVGGIPQNQTSEEVLQHFLNDVCAKCLEEENDNSYVISVYMNHKKCFAFVELKSIELTTACLELDGIVYCSNILKIQRANEYKPELMVNVPRVPIRFNVRNAPFPNKGSGVHADKKYSIEDHGSLDFSPGSRGSNEEKKFNFLTVSFSSPNIRSCNISEVARGSLVILGFPYDEGAKRGGQAAGAAAGPRMARQYLYQLFSADSGGVNPEFGVDFSTAALQLCDVGDVPLGLLLEEALSRLGENVAEIIRRGGVPFVLGGSGDMSYANAAGLMTVAGGNIGIISVNSHLNVSQQRSENKIQVNSASRLLLSDTRFCPPREGLMSEPWCDGKFVSVAAQGTCCSSADAKFVEERGGKIIWLSKDIRQVNPFSNTHAEPAGQLVKHGSSQDEVCTFTDSIPVSCSPCPSCHSPSRLISTLQPILTNLKGPSNKRPIYMSLHLESLHNNILPGVSTRSYDGLSAHEALQISFLAGSDENVAVFDLCGLNPDIEDSRSPMFVAQMAYYFILGFFKRANNRTATDSNST